MKVLLNAPQQNITSTASKSLAQPKDARFDFEDFSLISKASNLHRTVSDLSENGTD